MATRKYNVALGQTKESQVTEAVGSAVSSGFLQVTIDMAASPTPLQIKKALDMVAERVRQKWPPV